MKSLHSWEEKQRGSLDFPLEYHDLDENHPRYQMPYHWHEAYELLYVRTGQFALTLDESTIVLGPGEAALIEAGQLHGGEPQNCGYACVVFDMQRLLRGSDHCRPQIDDICRRRVRLKACYHADDPMVSRTISPMFRALQQKCPGYELIALGCLLQFLGEGYKQGAYMEPEPEEDTAPPGGRIEQLKQVFELIEKQYASSLTLEELAGSVHMSPKYFCRFFKATTHRTPIDYLNYFRVETACHEIAARETAVSGGNLTSIAMDVGFSSLNYFIRQFKKYKGMTPGQYQYMIRAAKRGG